MEKITNKLVVLVLIGSALVFQSARAQEGGGVPGTGPAQGNTSGWACSGCGACLNIPGTGCYSCGDAPCFCQNQYGQERYEYHPWYISTPCM